MFHSAAFAKTPSDHVLSSWQVNRCLNVRSVLLTDDVSYRSPDCRETTVPGPDEVNDPNTEHRGGSSACLQIRGANFERADLDFEVLEGRALLVPCVCPVRMTPAQP